MLNRGRHGAPLVKLGRIAEQTEKFLRSLAHDSRVSTQPGQWLAVNFKDGSVEYDAEFQGDVNVGDAQIFARNLEFLADYDSEMEGLDGSVSYGTALEFAKFGTLIDPDEVIGLGIYPGRGGPPKWREITYSKTASLRREVETPLPAHGAVQGKRWLWKFGQCDKWLFPSQHGLMAGERSEEDDKRNAPDPFPGFQGEGCPGGGQG